MRDEKTGKSKGFCFLKYEDFRSAVLAIDNFNGIEVRGAAVAGCALQDGAHRGRGGVR